MTKAKRVRDDHRTVVLIADSVCERLAQLALPNHLSVCALLLLVAEKCAASPAPARAMEEAAEQLLAFFKQEMEFRRDHERKRKPPRS
jgi:hypothetical protein